MNLVALLCVRSTCFNSSTDCGAHVCVAYPRCGLTKARYSVRRTAVMNSLVSSANIATWLDVNASGRSLKHKTKRREPRIEP
jgi:hypothetical protein